MRSMQARAVLVMAVLTGCSDDGPRPPDGAADAAGSIDLGTPSDTAAELDSLATDSGPPEDAADGANPGDTVEPLDTSATTDIAASDSAATDIAASDSAATDIAASDSAATDIAATDSAAQDATADAGTDPDTTGDAPAADSMEAGSDATDAGDASGSPDGSDAGGGDAGSGLTEIPGLEEALVVDELPVIPFAAPDEADFLIMEELAIGFRQIIVVFEPDAAVGEVNALLAEWGATIEGALPGGRVARVRVDGDNLVDFGPALAAFAAAPFVLYALPELALPPEALPPLDGDARWVWDLPAQPNGPAAHGNWGLELIRAPQVWHFDSYVRRVRTANRVSAGVIDAGFTDAAGALATPSTHPSFLRADGTAILTIEPSAAGAPSADEHGSFVAGIIGGVWDRGLNIEGLNPWIHQIHGRANRFSIKKHASYAQVLADIVQMLFDHPEIRAINNSYGCSGLFRHTYDRRDDNALNGSFQPHLVLFGDINGDADFLDALFDDLDGSTSWDPGEPVYAVEFGVDQDGDSLPDTGFDLDGDATLDTWSDVMRYYGDLYTLVLSPLVVGRDQFLIVSSAGNATAAYQARDNSPINSAAVRLGGRFLAVESIDWTNTASGFSNAGGSLSAPGGCVRSVELVDLVIGDSASCQANTTWADNVDNLYATGSGTSYAAPHVTALATILWQLDPSLTTAEVRELLTGPDTTVAAQGGANRRIDAFAAALGIDLLQGNTAMQEALVDVDDGTADGNQRTRRDAANQIVDPLYQHDVGYFTLASPRPRIRGDGRIGMADFRTFRDALLLVEADPGLLLDGDPTHSAFDLNQNGSIQPPADENLFPRYDFNGDGRLSRTLTPAASGITVPTHFQALTDLDVLAAVWPDDPAATEGVDASELPALLTSGDLEIHYDSLLESGADEVALRLTSATSPPRSRHIVFNIGDTCPAEGFAEAVAIWTVPPGQWDLTAESPDAIVRLGPIPITLGLGEDVRVDLTYSGPCFPLCGPAESCCEGPRVAYCAPLGACPTRCADDCGCPDGQTCCASFGNICVPIGECGGETSPSCDPEADPPADRVVALVVDASGSMTEEAAAIGDAAAELTSDGIEHGYRVLVLGHEDAAARVPTTARSLGVEAPPNLTEEEQESLTGLIARTRHGWSSFVGSAGIEFVLFSDEDSDQHIYDFNGALYAAGLRNYGFHAVVPLETDVGHCGFTESDVAQRVLGLQSEYCGQRRSICDPLDYVGLAHDALAIEDP